jgi:hypothetical protein
MKFVVIINTIKTSISTYYFLIKSRGVINRHHEKSSRGKWLNKKAVRILLKLCRPIKFFSPIEVSPFSER